jgi:tetratricopeptide (TPR) repeat protein|uniref:Tetratricopeptide repeat protein n=1 Tax=candidate division WOR-3 bacterium TaxID=2052148 RepID=A0A7V3VTC0_UNCW3
MKKAHTILFLVIVVLFFTGCPPTWKNGCKIYIQQGEYARAKEQALIGISTSPDDFEAYCLLGKAECGLGNYAEASKAFQNGFKKDSLKTLTWLKTDENGKNVTVYWQAFYSAGYRAYQDKKYEEALQNINFAKLLDPENPSQYILEGNIYTEMGEREKALSVFRKILEFDKENPEACYFIAKGFFDKQAYDSCLYYVDISIKSFEKEYTKFKNVLFKNVEFNSSLAKELVNLWKGNKKDALDQFIKVKLGFDEGLQGHEKNVEKFVKENEGLGRGYYLAGITYINLKNDTLALKNLRRSVEFISEDIDALFFLGETLIRLSKWAEARNYFEELVRIKPDDFPGWFYIGVSYLQEKNYKKAIEIFEEKALPLEPENLDVLTNLAVAYREIGNTKKAWEYLQKADKISKEKK